MLIRTIDVRKCNLVGFVMVRLKSFTCIVRVQLPSIHKNNIRGIKHHVIFHSLTYILQGPEGSVENRGRGPRFSTFPRDLANVNE